MKYPHTIIGIIFLVACKPTDSNTERFINEVNNLTSYGIEIRTFSSNRRLINLKINSDSSYTQDTTSFKPGANYNEYFFLSNNLNLIADSAVIEFSDGKELYSICQAFWPSPGPCPQEDLSLLNGGWIKEPVTNNNGQKIFRNNFTVTMDHYNAAK